MCNVYLKQNVENSVTSLVNDFIYLYCDANHKAPSDREIGLESERKKRENKGRECKNV